MWKVNVNEVFPFQYDDCYFCSSGIKTGVCCCDGHCQLRNGSRNCNCNGRCRLPKVRKTGCCFRPIVFSVYTYNNHLTSCFADTLHPIFSYTITRAFVSLRTGWIAIQLCGEMRPNSDGIANLRLGSRFFIGLCVLS